jgi:outer membrane protein OmpA-like peptidoglycan-associated protein/tetratricopeptide (TPR) repeat protein/YHS domain-containing protein
MSMRKISYHAYSFFSLLLLFNLSASVAQTNKKDAEEQAKEFKEATKLNSYIETEKKASNHFLHERYKFALPLYQQLIKINPEDYTLNYRLGLCYLRTTDKSQSLRYLEKAKSMEQKNASGDIDFFLGEAYHAHLEFDKAIEYYGKYKAKLSSNKKHDFDEELISEVNHLIEQCNSGKKLYTSPVNVKVDHLNAKINSPYSETYPVVSPDGNTIYFSSGRPLTKGGGLDPNSGQYYKDIYYSEKLNGQWLPAKQLDINTVGNDVPLSITSDGNTLFLSSPINTEAVMFFSEKSDTAWTKPREMDATINAMYDESGACISPDGKTFYFVSEEGEDGLGGKDIYKSKLGPDGTWGDPTNLGPQINTPYNEDDPFMLADGKTFYFSSQGHNSMGGYDIFVSKHDPQRKTWTVPSNLGYPINTPGDEVSVSWTGDGRIGYFSADNEKGFGNEDIYVINLAAAPKANTITQNVIAKSPKNAESAAKAYGNRPKAGEVLKDQVHFAFNESHAITEYSKNKINTIVALMNKYPDLTIEIEGFADKTDDDDYDKEIAQKRAETVREHLIKRGIDKSRLQLHISSAADGTEDEDEIELRSRRVEFKILK